MIFLAIDIQPGFEASTYVVEAAREEALRAKRFQYGIILLQYKKHGHTLDQVRSVTYGYHKASVAWKNSDDGSIEVLDKAFEDGYNTDVIRVCGVNTDYCVLDTVRGLSKFSPKSKILVRIDGCNSICDNSFKKFKKIPNVYLVGGKKNDQDKV